MRADLLDAYACVEWAVAQFDTLKARLVSWNEVAPYRWTEQTDSEVGEKLIRLRDVKLPDPIINAEVGFIIHAIRSSLDVLINILAQRNGHVAPKDAHLPVSRSKADFTTGKHAGRKAIKRLSPADRAVIEALEPWRGGNNPMLIALHDLDILRKHRRLIGVTAEPYSTKIRFSSAGQATRFQNIVATFENDAVVGRIGADEHASDVQIAFEITFSEGGPVKRQAVIEALGKFSCLANEIITLFDT